MDGTQIIWPMLAHVVLVYIAFLMLRVRRTAAARGGTSWEVFRTRGREPELSATANANISSQFELPVLFHVCCLVLLATAGVNYLTLVLAWLFILTRYVHAFVHMTSNDMRLRFPAFALGMLILGVMWIWVALHIAGIV